MSLLEWAAHFKNVRCVLAFDPQAPPDERLLGWLVRKHRWREAGVPPCLAGANERLSRKPFVRLAYPSPALEELAGAVAADHPAWLAEAVVLALCYAAPLVCPSRLHGELQPLLSWTLRAADPPEAELVRHLRIAGYVAVDFFPLIGEAHAALRRGSREELEALAGRRAARAAQDGRKRFWRLRESPEAAPLVSYLDLFPLLAVKRDALRELLQREEVGLALTITAAFFLPEAPAGP